MVSPTQPTPGLNLNDPESTLSTGKLIRRLLRLSWHYRWGCARVLALRVLMLLMVLSGLGLLGLGLDHARHVVDPSSPAPRFPWGLAPPATWSAAMTLLAISGGMLLAALLRFLLSYATLMSQARLVQNIVVHLRSAVYDKLQRLSFRFFDANESGSIINRVTGDVMAARQFVDGVIIPILSLVMTLGLYLWYMLSLHVTLTLACLASTPALWYVSARFSRTVKPQYRAARKLVDKLVLTLSESVQGIHVVKGFARQDEEAAKFGRDNAAVRDKRLGIFFKVAVFSPLITFLTQINIMILLAYGGYLVVIHEPATATAPAVGIPLGTGLVVFAALLQQFAAQVGNIATIANSMQNSMIGAQRVFEVLEAPQEIISPPNAVRLSRAHGRIQFEHVSFRYGHEEPVLRDVNFRIEPGQCIAIVGATGSGKSTLMSLIPRFYDPAEGRVLLDGMDLRSLELEDLRRMVGIVFQENFLFSNTIAANISFGHPEATAKQIERAARIAAAHEFIDESELGYDTVVGERGATLSGGQRQRLAIARALLLEPPILLLDDATSAVDPETEHEILAAMDSAMKGRTTFVVAHRLSTLRRATRVMVLEKGRIAQAGTHEELMSTQGQYRDAARLQTADRESRRLLGVETEKGVPR